MKHLLTRAALLLALLVTSTVGVFAQTALTTTTLGAAVTTNTQSVVSVASATGITAATTGANLVYLLVDRELLYVQTVTGTNIGVTRGAASTRAVPHLSGATVTIVPGLALYSYIPSGQCTRTTLLYVPWVVGGGPGLGSEVGSTWDCLGVTTAGQWARTDSNDKPTLGSTVVSANTIAPTGTYFKTSGTTVIKTITPPAGTAAGFCLVMEATGVDTWDATGNILTAGTFTAAGHFVTFCWNGAKWVPDKVS